jgi:rubrerythrin
MSTAAVQTTPEAGNLLAELFQYTVDAYKTFAKLAENLPNPISAETFAKFAENERAHRDLLEIRYLDPATPRMKIKLGGDLDFQDILEGDLSYRETAEMLISRERTMERKLVEAVRSGPESTRNLFRYIAAGKRANLALLERELEMIRIFPDWWKREDAQSIIIHGLPG